MKDIDSGYVSEFLQPIEITAFSMEHVSYSPDGMVEYWNVDLSKKVTHLLTPMSREILPTLHLVQDKITHYSIIPVFLYFSCERSELSSDM